MRGERRATGRRRATGDLRAAAERPGDRPAAELPIGLVALDIDGTLIGDDLALRPRTIAAVASARERGVHVSLVTGRMTSSAIVFARQLGLVDPIVAFQGALVRELPPPERDPRLGRILDHRPLPAVPAREVVTWARSVGLEPHVNHLERFVIQADDPRAEDYSSFLGARATLVPDLIAWIDHPVSKVLAVSAEPIPESILDDARRRFAGRAAVTISHPRFLEFLALGVSKAVGVRHLARRAHVPMSRVLAIGDQFNDLEMLAEVGHGAAMPSAPLPVRLAARYVAPSLADEGAAQLIEQLVLADADEARGAAKRLAEEHDRIRAAAERHGEHAAAAPHDAATVADAGTDEPRRHEGSAA